MDMMGLQKVSPERTHHHPCSTLAWNAKFEPHQEETSDTSGTTNRRNIPFFKIGRERIVFKNIYITKGKGRLQKKSRLIKTK